MKIAIFTEGTILMHKNAIGHTHNEILQQVIDKESSVKEYASYIPIGNAVKKIKKWSEQWGNIVYITSRRLEKEVNEIKEVLHQNNFPDWILEYRIGSEKYKDIAEKIKPDIIIEDDCESIGWENETIYYHINQQLKKNIKSIIVNEFLGIDHLPENIKFLQN